MLIVAMMSIASGAGAQNLHNGHAYIDLGLSVKWATYNVGADSPDEYGDYYAWGETATKSSYYAKNCTTWEQEVGDISGTLQYDAATAKWGGSWRMPSLEEFNELQNNCTWEWTTLGDVKGYKVTSNINGNTIFLPAAGYRAEEKLEAGGVRGMYWVSTAKGTQYAYNYYFDSGYKCAYWISRADGHSIRPVLNIDGGTEGSDRDESGNENSNDDDSKRGLTTKRSANEESANEEPTNDGVVNYEPTKSESSNKESAKDEPAEAITEATYNGHAYVDLGLSVKWATCNVGANSPWHYGDYYAWGETATKSTYTENSYVADIKNHEDIKGTTFDVAHIKWGGNWRMPTKTEFEELVDNCSWEWTTLGDVKGYKVTSNINGNSIFLPAAGYRHEESLKGAALYGHYWSSTPYVENHTMAYLLYINESCHSTNWEACALGYSVRPVVE